MKNYKHVLVAVELIGVNDAELIKRADFMAKEFKTNVVLVHAIEHIGSYSSYGMGMGFEIEKALIDSATAEMRKLGKHLDIPEHKQLVKVGPAKFVILEEAEKLKADLIIVGSHGRHGLQILFAYSDEIDQSFRFKPINDSSPNRSVIPVQID
ncbi:Universal stress protein A homolog 2 [Gammaproteobacteria bacterium]